MNTSQWATRREKTVVERRASTVNKIFHKLRLSTAYARTIRETSSLDVIIFILRQGRIILIYVEYYP